MTALEDQHGPRSAQAAAVRAHRSSFRTELLNRIESAGLNTAIEDLDTKGYCVLRNVAPPSLVARLRQRLLELAEPLRDRPSGEGLNGAFGVAIGRLLEQGEIFEQAVLDPTLGLVMTYLLGDGHLVNVVTGSVMPEGTPSLGIHSDNNFVPEPFPPSPLVATAVWALTDFTAEGGASRVVPGSHRSARHPAPGEGDDHAVAVACPAGSIIVWNGATWHGNCGRTDPGERIALHTSFCRMFVRPFADLDAVSDEIVARNPPRFAQLLGRELPFGAEGECGTDPLKLMHAQLTFNRRI